MYLIRNEILFVSHRKEYFRYDLGNQQKKQIKPEDYCEVLFGKYNYRLLCLLGSSISIKVDKIYSAFYQAPDLLIHNTDGDLIERKKNFFEGMTPYEIVVIEERNEVWAATGAGQVVTCQEINSGELKFQIGISYEEKSELSYPESINRYDDELFITEMGNRRVMKFNLNSQEKSIYLQFDEPAWGFQKNEFREIALLDSGVYEIKEGEKIKINI